MSHYSYAQRASATRWLRSATTHNPGARRHRTMERVTPSESRSMACSSAPERVPGRRQLAGARLPGRGRHAAVHGAPDGAVADRRRRQPLRRPGRLVGPDAAGPRAPRGRRGRADAAVQRGTSFGTPSEPEVELAEEIVGAYAGRPGAAGVVRDRGDDVGDPAGPRVHRPRPRREVRRLLPRPRRRAAGRGRLGRRDVRPAGHARVSRRTSRPTRSCCRTTTALRSRPRSPTYGDQIACLITEAAPGNMGVVPPEPGFNALPGRDLPRATARCSSATR